MSVHPSGMKPTFRPRPEACDISLEPLGKKIRSMKKILLCARCAHGAQKRVLLTT